MSFPGHADLPVLGVGASLSFGAQPDPAELARMRGGPAFIEYAGAVQTEALEPGLSRLRAQRVPLLYHPSCLNLCGPWPNPPGWVAAVDRHCREVGSAWLAQDVAVCFASETPGYSIQLGYFVPPLLTRASLDEAIARVGEVRAGVATPLLLEPAPVTFRLGPMSIFEWLGTLAQETGCGLLLDAGHVVSHQMAAGRGLLEGLDQLDLSRVIEMHVAGGVIHDRDGRRFYQDAHDLPVLPETWQVFDALLARCPELRAVCVECEGSLAGAILPVLEQVRVQVADRAANPALAQAAQAQLEAVR